MRFEIIQPTPEEEREEEVIKLGFAFDGDSVYVYSINSKGKYRPEVWFNYDGTMEIMVPKGQERTQKIIASNFKELLLS